MPDTATGEEVAQAIKDEARRIADEEIYKLIGKRIRPLENRFRELEEEVARLRRAQRRPTQAFSARPAAPT